MKASRAMNDQSAPVTSTGAAAVIIRACEEGDVPAITAIYHHHVLHGAASFEIEPPDAAEMARRRLAVVDGGYPYLVAEQGGRVAGYAYASAYRPRPAYRNTVENSVYVEPGRERQGIGRVLLAALLEACERRGFRQVVAVIGDSGHEASIGLHRALGFRMVGTLQSAGFKFGRWIDIVLMQRALGPGDETPPSR
jgi:phosphinothricin acetyltransferase